MACPREQADLILADLAASTPLGIDGYPQRFGIPDGLYAEPVAVKQGWMCCWGPDNQVHLSTGVAGPDRRYIIAVASMQPADEANARSTLTQAIKTMFPADVSEIGTLATMITGNHCPAREVRRRSRVRFNA